MFWELKSRLDEIGLLSTPNMCCGLVKGKVILHQALLSCGCGWFCFVWFDSLRLINNLSVIKGLVFLGWTSTKLGLMFLLKDTTQWRRWGSNPRSRVKHSTTEPLRFQGCVVESSTLPLSNCASKGVWLMLTKFTEVFNKPHIICFKSFVSVSGFFWVPKTWVKVW